ncbi:SGNH/GDSL hydrolase family protein [Curtobacterium caseinilyticum]|uniref:SGNH/GDSL hydrolase family protein n=1 Tax=Curtobacterium caseinilyticum TaxID=3055137 RepID=A0ABT7TQI3_9MICO|nr:SGNH/GDSL hydrolase family protein [Curtobacterium caseinilyticum]MDM7891861.1 SGNH/GDSL hydrolase family protein [Curtobacterium caseinilyticum]
MTRRTKHDWTNAPRSAPVDRGRRRRRPLLPTIALSAMAVGVAGLMALLPTVADACTDVPEAVTVQPERVRAAIAPGSDVLIVGDSYTRGSGSYDGLHGWAQDITSGLRWDATIDGVGGSGYVSGAAARASSFTFGARLHGHRFLDPDLVLVQGSQNDWVQGATQDVLQRTVERTLREARQQWPDAVVVAIGPSAPRPRAEATTDIAAAVAAGARSAGVPYVDPLAGQWFTDANSPSFATPDGQHLNDAGYAYLADRITGALRALATPTPDEQCH